MTEHQSTPAPIRIAVIGAGPAALMTLERLIARHARDTPGLPVAVRLIDRYAPGGGRIWRREQSPLLKLNSLLRDVTVFTDDSCAIEGPITPGPALDEWVRLVRAGQVALPAWAGDSLDAEIERVTDIDFPTRRLNNAYLGWAYDEIVSRAAPGLTVEWVPAYVTDLSRAEPSSGVSPGFILALDNGSTLEADLTVHQLGHNGSDPSGESVALDAFAKRHGLGYVAPAFTADLEFDWIPAGEPVIVRGMGLAAVDLVVLLTEGRGGRYVREGDGARGTRLRYLPSGEEPQLYLGSRRGVPYRSKITSTLAGAPTELEYLGASFHAAVAARAEPLDFERDVWPLIAAELLTGYYRELFTGHPERVRGEWASFHESLAATLATPGGTHGEGLRALIESAVPDPLDRFDLDSFDRPLAGSLGGEASASESRALATAGVAPGQALTGAPAPAEVGASAPAAVQRAVIEHIERDLRVRTRQEHSATQGLFLTALFAYMSVADVPREKWNARSLTVSLPKTWHSYFSYLASGPPGHRLEEFLALADAGVLHFLGGELRLETDETRGIFRASGSVGTLADRKDGASELAPNGGGGRGSASIEANALVDAWLPDANALKSDNPLLKRLVESGQAREVATFDGVFSASTGQLLVTPEGRLPDSPGQFALGPFTSTPTGGAFARPGINSLPFRRHDAFAGEILSEAASLARGVAPRPTAPA